MKWMRKQSTLMQETEVEFYTKDFTDQGLAKIVAIYSHGLGKDIRVSQVKFPEPVVIAHVNLGDIKMTVEDR